jgi:hypothetical protein
MSEQKKNSGTSGRNGRSGSVSSQNPISTKTIVGSVAVLFVAMGIGIAVRNIRTRSAEPQVTNAPEVNETPKEPEIPIIVRPRPVEEVAVEPAPQPEPEPANETPVQNEQASAWNNRQAMWQNSPQMQDAAQWMSWFSNLSQEERMQLMQGVLTSYIGLMQRWQSMPAEQIQAEREQFQQMIQEWRNLPSDQRQQGIQMIQQQLQQMIQSGQQ